MEGWVNGVGSDGPALCGDMFLSRCLSGLRGHLCGLGHPACSSQEQRWICDGELSPRQLTASGTA